MGRRRGSCQQPWRIGYSWSTKFIVAGDGETGEEETGWDLATGRGQERYEGSEYSEHTDIHWQAPSDGGTVVGPPSHIRSLRAGYGVKGRGVETAPWWRQTAADAQLRATLEYI